MRKIEFQALWKQYEPFLQAIVELFHPFAEAAVHDLSLGKIVALYHSLSGRKVGEPSPIKELKVKTEEFPDYFTPYYKENFDGRPLKCTSITLRDKFGKAVGLICVNVDVAFFQEANALLSMFLQTKSEAENPVEIFGGDSEQLIENVIREYLEEHHLRLTHLKRGHKKEITQRLYHKGVFNFKNAAPYIAKKLNSSRASIYNYIRERGEK